MKKAKIKFDIDLLTPANVPNDRGSDGDHPIVRVLKRKYAEDPEDAHLFYERLHKAHAHKPKFAWLERIKDKKKP